MSSRALVFVGKSKPWMINVATVKSIATLDLLFGADRAQTHAMTVGVQCITNLKTHEYDTVYERLGSALASGTH